MREKRVKLESECNENMYRAWYRCNNCGTIFQFDLQKGTNASAMKGSCPECGIKSGTANCGVFPIIKYNPEQDEIQRHYFR
jgi:DNA-directed RNA polymerase subunit RPC12/RpoP